MSPKKKSSRLRLRSQTASINSRNQNAAVISHYFKKPSFESDEAPSTCEISSKDDDKSDELSSFGNKDISNSVKVNSDKIPRTKALNTQKLLNLSDDLSDFSTPKPIKRVVPKIFEPKFKPKSVPKRNKKPINKKITEASRKFLYESKDYNQEHLQLAIALSKSIQDFENPGESSENQPSNCVAHNELTPTQENVLEIRKKLTKFQFKKNTDAFVSKNEDIPIPKTGKSKKARNHPFMATLIRRTCEDRQNIIQRKILNILLEKAIINHEKRFYNDLKICDNLEKYFCDEKVLFKKAALAGENFYTNQLVTPTTAKCGNLLRDWSNILGRELTPPREIERSKQESYLNDKSCIQSKELEQNIEVSKNLETSKHDQHKNCQVLEVPKHFHVELNEEVAKNLNDSNQSKSLIENNIELSKKFETLKDDQNREVDKKSETLEFSQLDCINPYEEFQIPKNYSNEFQISKSLHDSNNSSEQIIPNKNITIRSLTPDLFSESEDEIFFENPLNPTFTGNHVPKKILTIEEEILDLTQSSNSDHDLTQSTGKHSEDKSNNSNDSLFDLPKFDIKYTTTKSKNDDDQEIVNSILLDLSQSSNSNDHETTLKQFETKKNHCSVNRNSFSKTIMETSSTKSPSNKNFNFNFENNQELVVDLSQSSNTTKYNISQEISIKLLDTENISNGNLTEESQIVEKSSSKRNLNQSDSFYDREMLVDLSQSSNSNDDTSIKQFKTEIPKKMYFFDDNSSKNISIENESSMNLNKSNFNSNIENDGEMHVDLSHGDNCSINRFVMETPNRNESFNLSLNCSNIKNECELENSTLKSTLSSFDFKLKRKSKSFVDENQIQNNTNLRKYNSFMENFDYQLETSTHISLNANKSKIIDSNTSNLNSQTESDDSLIIISDDELNYSCSTPYRKIKSEKTFRNISRKSSTCSINESPSKLPTELTETDSSSPKTNTDSLERVEQRKGDVEKCIQSDLPTNISLLLGDSFERELRRTTSLWDRVCGKKIIQISNTQTPHEVHKKITRNFKTPTTQMEIKTHDVTPMPNYDAMETPNIRKELQKYGLKSLKRRRAAQILKYIYEQTHPYDDDGEASTCAVETYSDTEDNNRQVKRSKCSASATKLDDFVPVATTKIEIVGDLLSKNCCSESDLIFETRQSTKIASCRLPFHIAWHNYVSENPELRLKILKYFPIQLEEICIDFKQMGFKYNVNEILSFLDKKCITIRTNQNNHRNQKPKSMSSMNTKKRY